MVLFGRVPLTEGTVAGLTSIAAMIALGVTRHQAEDARRLLAAMVASSDEAIYGTNRNGTVVTWNAGAERVFGYTSAEIVGRPVKLLYPPDREYELPVVDCVNRGEHVKTTDDSPASGRIAGAGVADLVADSRRRRRRDRNSAIARDMAQKRSLEDQPASRRDGRRRALAAASLISQYGGHPGCAGFLSGVAEADGRRADVDGSARRRARPVSRNNCWPSAASRSSRSACPRR